VGRVRLPANGLGIERTRTWGMRFRNKRSNERRKSGSSGTSDNGGNKPKRGNSSVK